MVESYSVAVKWLLAVRGVVSAMLSFCCCHMLGFGWPLRSFISNSAAGQELSTYPARMSGLIFLSHSTATKCLSSSTPGGRTLVPRFLGPQRATWRFAIGRNLKKLVAGHN